MTAGERYQARVRAWQSAFDGARPRALSARLRARLGLAALARYLLRDRAGALSVALADFARACGGLPDQAIFVDDDPSGRIHAYNEGMRQAYLYLARLLAVDVEEIRREALRMDREEERRIDAEVTRRLADAA